VELTAIITGVLITVGASWSWPAWVLAAWVAGHPDLLRAAGRWTGELVGWLWRLAGHDRGRRAAGPGPGGSALMLTLAWPPSHWPRRKAVVVLDAGAQVTARAHC
jgi:hypothetical protein